MEPREEHTRMSPIDDFTILQRLSDKLDRLMEELPKSYQDRDSYQRQHEAITRRVDTLEQDLKDLRKTTLEITEKINGLHNSSMSWVNDTFAKVNERIVDEATGIREKMSQTERAIYSAILFSILIPILLVIINHYWK